MISSPFHLQNKIPNTNNFDISLNKFLLYAWMFSNRNRITIHAFLHNSLLNMQNCKIFKLIETLDTCFDIHYIDRKKNSITIKWSLLWNHMLGTIVRLKYHEWKARTQERFEKKTIVSNSWTPFSNFP